MHLTSLYPEPGQKKNSHPRASMRDKHDEDHVRLWSKVSPTYLSLHSMQDISLPPAQCSQGVMLLRVFLFPLTHINPVMRW